MIQSNLIISMKEIFYTVDNNYSEIDAIFDFLKSHSPSDSVLNSSFVSFFSVKSSEERIKQYFQKMADEYSAICTQARQLASIADEQSLQFVINVLQYNLKEYTTRRDTLLTRYSNIANIFALVGLCLVVYGKAVSTQILANAGLLTCILGGGILIFNIVTTIKQINIEIHLSLYYIWLLKQAQS